MHRGSKGTVRENIVNQVIRPFLPACYGMSGGEAFDNEGNTSRQLDLVVYDAVFSYVIPYIDGFMQFPCESIYGNIEIKSYLNSEEFENAIKNIASMKSLKRKGTHSWTVTPQVAIQVNGKPNDTDRNPYFGIIFAYDSVEVETILKYVSELEYTSDLLPNMIVLYSKKTIMIQAKNEQIEAYPKNNFNRYVALECGDETLAVFIGLLINFTRHTLLAAADIPSQTNSALQRILERNIANESVKVTDVRVKV